MKRILLYGDSNTFGTAPMPHLGSDPIHPRGVRWGDVLARELGEGFEVVIEGLGGRTAVLDDPVEGAWKNGLRSLKPILGSHRPIDLLIVCLGTNDQKARFGLGPQEVALGLARLVREAHLTGWVARRMVIAPPRVRERGDFAAMFAGAEARMTGLADAIARFAGAEGAEVMDAGRLIEACDEDGIHWTAEAHGTLGRAVAERVREMLG